MANTDPQMWERILREHAERYPQRPRRCVVCELDIRPEFALADPLSRPFGTCVCPAQVRWGKVRELIREVTPAQMREILPPFDFAAAMASRAVYQSHAAFMLEISRALT